MRFLPSSDEYQWIAPFYDPMISPFMLPIRREVCRLAQAHDFKNILDLCSGTGEQCILLDRRGFRVTGVDLSPAMIAVARRKSPERIKYYQEDAANLPFKEGSFDCVTSTLALHEKDFQTRRRILGEARRVLAPGENCSWWILSPPAAPCRESAKLSFTWWNGLPERNTTRISETI